MRPITNLKSIDFKAGSGAGADQKLTGSATQLLWVSSRANNTAEPQFFCLLVGRFWRRIGGGGGDIGFDKSHVRIAGFLGTGTFFDRIRDTTFQNARVPIRLRGHFFSKKRKKLNNKKSIGT